MEDEHVGRFRQKREAEPFPDPRLRATSEEEFDPWDLGYKLPEDGQDRRSGLLVLAFVQSVDDDHRRNVGFLEGFDNQFSHLTIQRFVDESWIGMNQWDEGGSELGVSTCKLDRKSREDEVEVAPIREVPRTEERGSKLTVCEHPFCDRLGDGALPGPGQPVQPIDGRLVEIPCPDFDLVQDSSTGSLQTTFAVTMAILCGLSTSEIIEDGGFSC